ncbi:MAG: transglutaminase-like cysteine peptidase [Chromatiaceae bacterium]|jgi:predicted transglutaminase-like cysteine proteinase|nr:transglutaminase-like cysteine peptidase [Chromatiaceae bacterium]
MSLVALNPMPSAGRHHAVLVAGLGLLLAGWAFAQGLVFNAALLNWIEHEYGDAARDRVVELQELVAHGEALDERAKLERVNAFFNRIGYDSDDLRWDQKDYWATPFEVLGVNSADCEDYAISKYFTLISMGVEEQRLRITYVKSIDTDEAHMVLGYYPSPEADPLILDNLTARIAAAAERTDLVPVYSFNGTDLWLAVNGLEPRRVGSADRLSRWRAYQSRLMQQMAMGRETVVQ